MLVSGLVLGIVAGLAVRRSWEPLLRVEIRWLALLLASLFIRVVASLVGEAGYVLYVGALAGTAVAAAANYRLAGAPLIALGGCLNLAVVLANGGMPVDGAALATAGAHMPHDALHVALDAGSRLGVLADVIPIPVVRSVYSIGDVLIAIGGFLVPFVLLARR
jgi:hypothetical protein